MIDANQVWDVDEAIEWHAASWRASSPGGSRSRPAPTTCSATRRSRAPIAPIGVATGEHCQNRVMFKQLLQAGAIALLPDRRLPARRRERGARGAAAGGEVRRAGLPARRRRRPVRVRAAPVDVRLHLRQRRRSRTASSSTSTTCTSTSSTRASIRDGRYMPPTAPGYSITMQPESLREYAFPDGAGVDRSRGAGGAPVTGRSPTTGRCAPRSSST